MTQAKNAHLRIICTGLSLWLFLALIRGYLLASEPETEMRGFMLLVTTALASFRDALYVVTLALVFLILALLPGTGAGWSRWCGRLFLALALISFYVSLLNVPFILLLGRPFTYQWLYYADFFRSASVWGLVLKFATWPYLILLAGAGPVLAATATGLWRLTEYALRKGWSRRVLTASLAAAVAAYFVLAGVALRFGGDDPDRFANSSVYFAGSLWQIHQSPRLFTAPTTISDEDFRPQADQPPSVSILPRRPATPVRNVLLYVWESVGAEHLEPVPGRPPVTPQLNSYFPQAARFRAMYAQAPTSNKSLVNILCSQYPWASYRGLTSDYPAIYSPSLADQFQSRGYRTAFLSTGDVRFQRTDEFLRHRGFQVIEDYRNWPGNGRVYVASTRQWSNLDGGDEKATADRFLQWQAQEPDKPFFAVLWTNMTHYPYFAGEEEIDFGVKDVKHHRYLNAIHHTDRQLGRILRELQQRQLLESTLVMVAGDHGEAFGRHNQFGHGSKIYEENIHVPCVLIQPNLFGGEVDQKVSSLVDLAPTIADLAGIPPAPTWQGRSLFSNQRTGRAYFLAPWADCWFGYREGNRKFIFNSTANRCELYDLHADPYETINLIDRHPEAVAAGLERLAAWVQFQNRFIAKLIEHPPNRPAAQDAVPPEPASP